MNKNEILITISGATGAGKTTVMNMLQRLLTGNGFAVEGYDELTKFVRDEEQQTICEDTLRGDTTILINTNQMIRGHNARQTLERMNKRASYVGRIDPVEYLPKG